MEKKRKSISEKTSLKNKKENALYRKMFSGMNAIVFIFDLNKYRLVWVNDAFKKILGFTRQRRNIPEEEMYSLYHPEDRDLLKEMKSFFTHNKSGTFTAIYKFMTINNDYIWMCTVANLFRKSKDDSVFEVVGVSIDLTNQITYNKNLKVLSREKLKEINKEQISKITRREREVLKYFANGFKTKEIAEKLGLSFHTVNNHRKNILKKLKIKNLAALVSFASENGLT